MLGRAKERAAEAEQLAMDATRLLSVRPEQLAVTAKQPFYARLWRQLSGQPLASLTASQDQLFEMQRIGWRYIQMLNERDLMLAHSMIMVKNNLLTLAVDETETRQMLTDMANRIADRFERLEDKVDQLEVQQNIHGWLLTLETRDYPDHYPERLRLLRVIQDFLQLKPSNWSLQEIRYLQKALKEVDLPWRGTITLADFIDGLIDDIEASGFDSYAILIRLGDTEGSFEPKRVLDHIATPSYRALFRIADSYGSSSDTIDILLADKPALSRKEALKNVLRSFIRKEGIDTGVTVPLRDLAVELLGCQSLARRLLTADVPAASQPRTEARPRTLPADQLRAQSAAPAPKHVAPPSDAAPTGTYHAGRSNQDAPPEDFDITKQRHGTDYNDDYSFDKEIKYICMRYTKLSNKFSATS